MQAQPSLSPLTQSKTIKKRKEGVNSDENNKKLSMFWNIELWFIAAEKIWELAQRVIDDDDYYTYHLLDAVF